MAQQKKAMIKEGKLDKHGKPNDKTPQDFTKSYKDYSKSKPPALSGEGAASVASPAKSEDVKMQTTNGGDDDSNKKRTKESSSGDGSSGDEQPVKKKEKKEKKEKKDKKEKKEKKKKKSIG